MTHITGYRILLILFPLLFPLVYYYHQLYARTDLDHLKDYYRETITVSDQILLQETNGYRGIYTKTFIPKGTEIIRGKNFVENESSN